jgi:hypothetical protein
MNEFQSNAERRPLLRAKTGAIFTTQKIWMPS